MSEFWLNGIVRKRHRVKRNEALNGKNEKKKGNDLEGKNSLRSSRRVNLLPSFTRICVSVRIFHGMPDIFNKLVTSRMERFQKKNSFNREEGAGEWTSAASKSATVPPDLRDFPFVFLPIFFSKSVVDGGLYLRRLDEFVGHVNLRFTTESLHRVRFRTVESR